MTKADLCGAWREFLMIYPQLLRFSCHRKLTIEKFDLYLLLELWISFRYGNAVLLHYLKLRKLKFRLKIFLSIYIKILWHIQPVVQYKFASIQQTFIKCTTNIFMHIHPFWSVHKVHKHIWQTLLWPMGFSGYYYDDMSVDLNDL